MILKRVYSIGVSYTIGPGDWQKLQYMENGTSYFFELFACLVCMKVA